MRTSDRRRARQLLHQRAQRSRRSPSCPTTPTSCEQLLDQMAGPGATMRVNGFRAAGCRRSRRSGQIRFRMNSFAAEYHEGGGFGIDIITKPGMDDWRGMTQLRLPRRVAERAQRVRADAGARAVPPVRAQRGRPARQGQDVARVELRRQQLRTTRRRSTRRRPTGRSNGRCGTPRGSDVRIGARRALALEDAADCSSRCQRNDIKRDNLGVGDFDLPSRAYTSETADTAVALRAERPLAPKVAHELKVRFESSYATQSSLTPTRRSSFSGRVHHRRRRAEAATGRRRRSRSPTTSTGRSRKKHAFRAGLLGEADWYRHDATSRTSTARSPSAASTQYDLGLPTTYTQRSARAARQLRATTQLGLYVQDTWTPNKRVSLSLGLRAGVPVAPRRLRRTSRRASASRGRPSKYTVRGGYGDLQRLVRRVATTSRCCCVNGVTQQDDVIRFPGYPDPQRRRDRDAAAAEQDRARLRAWRCRIVHQASIGIERTSCRRCGCRRAT